MQRDLRDPGSLRRVFEKLVGGLRLLQRRHRQPRASKGPEVPGQRTMVGRGVVERRGSDHPRAFAPRYLPVTADLTPYRDLERHALDHPRGCIEDVEARMREARDE